MSHAIKALADLSTREQRTLDRIYQHSMTHNLELRDVSALFETIGGAEPLHNGDIRLSIGSETLTMMRPHSKDLSTDEVILIRHFLDRTGWALRAIEGPWRPARESLDMVIVIDHAGARVHRMGDEDATRHLTHESDTREHDRDRDETFPDDERFFAQIAGIAADADRIVVIGHGHGQSNAAAHLIAWLDQHDKTLRARVCGVLQADLPHTTDPELLALAVEALAHPASDAPQKEKS